MSHHPFLVDLRAHMRNRSDNRIDFLAPYVGFPLIFILGLLLAMLPLTTNVIKVKPVTIIVVISSMICYLCGALSVLLLNSVYGARVITICCLCRENKRYLKILFVLYAICMGALLYEYTLFGSIPLLSATVENDRFAFMQSGYIHLIAMTIVPTSLCIIAYFIENRKTLSSSTRRLLLGAIVFAAFAVLGVGSRGHLIISIAIILVYYHYRKTSIRLITFCLFGVVGFVFLSAFKFLREYLLWGDLYIASLDSIWRLKGYYWLVPGYLTVAMNYSVLDKLIETFPNNLSHTYGYFFSFPIRSLFPGVDEDLGQFQNRVWDTGFDKTLTSTYLGVPFADFGIIGTSIFSFCLGLAMTWLYVVMKQRRTPSITFVYSYLVVNLYLCLYTNNYQYFHFYWNLVYIAFLSNLWFYKNDSNNHRCTHER
ncbi:O-antigen polymerase [Geobacter sulfurreducens]|uniref:O-antigen polymerase n=1 Tax=Geobacter sulfurreducens TaxID=35554 RepID=UPI002CB95C50|nr:O-antigen polymerase [Geobacter sulfurreducens]HML78127.1 O-antigen polymerase [Geobacter sulfurreducens]